MKKVFVDASAWIALYHKRDKYHQTAWIIYEQLLSSPVKFLTSNWVSYEAISFIKSRSSYDAAEALWDILQDGQLFQIIKVDRAIEKEAVNMFWKYKDKKWGIVDCSSMILMEKKKCRTAFGYDQHFAEASKQYGFILL